MSGPDSWGQRSSFSHASVKNISLLSIHSNHKYKLSLIKSVIPYASNQRSKLSYTSLYLYMSMALSICVALMTLLNSSKQFLTKNSYAYVQMVQRSAF